MMIARIGDPSKLEVESGGGAKEDRLTTGSLPGSPKEGLGY